MPFKKVRPVQGRSTHRLIRSTANNQLNGLNGMLNGLNGSDVFERHLNGRSTVCPSLLLTRHDFGLATRARRIYWEVTIWCYYKISRFALLNIIMKLITLSSIVLTGHAASYRECLVKARSITDCQKICDISSHCWFWVYKACVIKSCILYTV